MLWRLFLSIPQIDYCWNGFSCVASYLSVYLIFFLLNLKCQLNWWKQSFFSFSTPCCPSLSLFLSLSLCHSIYSSISLSVSDIIKKPLQMYCPFWNFQACILHFCEPKMLSKLLLPSMRLKTDFDFGGISYPSKSSCSFQSQDPYQSCQFCLFSQQWFICEFCVNEPSLWPLKWLSVPVIIFGFLCKYHQISVVILSAELSWTLIHLSWRSYDILDVFMDYSIIPNEL